MVWSKRLSPSGASGSSRPRSRRAAIAMPTALPTPWPSGPVVVSTPGVWLTSGWPGVCEPQVRSASQVVELHAVAGEVELDVERQARVAHREHEPVAADPVRVAGVVLQPLLEEQVGGRGHAHRRPRVAVADLLDGVHREHAGGVDGAAVELAEAVGEGRVAAGPGCRWGRRSRPRPGPRTRCSASCGGCSLEVGPACAAERLCPDRAPGRAPSSSTSPYPLHTQHQRDQP